MLDTLNELDGGSPQLYLQDPDHIDESNQVSTQVQFAEIDVVDDAHRRSIEFNALAEHQRADIFQRIIDGSMIGDTDVLPLLKKTGRETDLSLLDDLSHLQPEADLQNVEIAILLFSMTYKIWETNNLIVAGKLEESREAIRSKLQSINASALQLSRFTITATHSTSEDIDWHIDDQQYLLKSDSTHSRQHEGDGIYTGILGYYQSWNNGTLFKFPLSLADAIPIIVSYNDPKAMANALGDILDFQRSPDIPAIVHGLIQWRQCDFDNDECSDTKLDLLEDVLESDVEILTDDDGRDCLTSDTLMPPIVWAGLCQALRIRRFVPRSELSKLQLDKRHSADEELASTHVVDRPDSIEELSQGIRIRGVKAKYPTHYGQ